MFNRKLTKVLAGLLSVSCLLTTTSALTVSADETIGSSNTNAQVFVLNEEDNGQPPIYYGDDSIMPLGANPPFIADVWSLYSGGSYTASILSFKHLVYSDVVFSTVTGKIKVTISGSSLYNYLNLGGKTVTIELYKCYTDSNGNYHETIIKSSNCTSATNSFVANFSNLDTTAHYYVAVSKTQDNVYINNTTLTVSLG